LSEACQGRHARELGGRDRDHGHGVMVAAKR
jgi:hypothetical protein